MTVMNLVMPLAGLVKVRYGEGKADIDSPFFKLHYRTTATLMFLSCLLVTANDLIGSTIDCITNNIPKNVINSYCWIMSTFTIPSQHAAGHGVDYAHQGVSHYNQGGDTEKTYHAYYQWVPFILFFQGVLFYLPHFIWKIFEDQKLNKITNDLRGRTLSLSEREGQCEKLVAYMKETIHTHNFYAFKYFLCDFLNLVNVVGQIFLIDKFLGGVFMTYGTEVLNWGNADPETRTDPLREVFPTLTKCEFHKYGPSGTIEKHDALCVLALNIINEKIFTMMWFWFIILAIITALYLMYVIAVISLPAMRKRMLSRNAKTHHHQLNVDTLTRKAELGDWFLLFLLSRNLDSILYANFLIKLTEKLEAKA